MTLENSTANALNPNSGFMATGFCKSCATAYEVARFKQAKQIAIDRLGGKCSCCGITDIRILTVEHKKGNGINERKILGTRQIYRKIAQINDPFEDYDCLCCNCNYSKYHFGICGHKIK